MFIVSLHWISEEPLDSCFLHAGAQHISSISRASFQSDQEASFILPDIIRRSINHRPHGLYIDQAWAIKKHLNYGKVQTYWHGGPLPRKNLFTFGHLFPKTWQNPLHGTNLQTAKPRQRPVLVRWDCGTQQVLAGHWGNQIPHRGAESRLQNRFRETEQVHLLAWLHLRSGVRQTRQLKERISHIWLI